MFLVIGERLGCAGITACVSPGERRACCVWTIFDYDLLYLRCKPKHDMYVKRRGELMGLSHAVVLVSATGRGFSRAEARSPEASGVLAPQLQGDVINSLLPPEWIAAQGFVLADAVLAVVLLALVALSYMMLAHMFRGWSGDALNATGAASAAANSGALPGRATATAAAGGAQPPQPHGCPCGRCAAPLRRSCAPSCAPPPLR